MRLWSWQRETREAELDEELRTHMDMATQARVERGVNQKLAEGSARLEFGNVEMVKEAARDQWGRRWVEELPHGVMAYLVTQRTHEIGLRVPLGAQQGDILQLVIGRRSRLAFMGVSFGVVLALALTKLLSVKFLEEISKELFGVTATDPLTFVCVSLLLTLVALAACYIPARRAIRVDPLTALRYE